MYVDRNFWEQEFTNEGNIATFGREKRARPARAAYLHGKVLEGWQGSDTDGNVQRR